MQARIHSQAVADGDVVLDVERHLVAVHLSAGRVAVSRVGEDTAVVHVPDIGLCDFRSVAVTDIFSAELDQMVG